MMNYPDAHSFKQQAAHAMAQSQANSAPSVAPANDHERIIDRLEATQKQAWLLRDRLERIISRAYGAPTCDEAGNLAPVPAGSVGRISALLDTIGGDLDRAQEAINRLDGLA